VKPLMMGWKITRNRVSSRDSTTSVNAAKTVKPATAGRPPASAASSAGPT
jgi:hypothetical protein